MKEREQNYILVSFHTSRILIYDSLAIFYSPILLKTQISRKTQNPKPSVDDPIHERE